MFALWFVVDSIRSKTKWIQIVAKIPLFALFGTGALLTFLYFYIQYGHFWLFFEAQREYFSRGDQFYGWTEIKALWNGNYATYWDTVNWTSMIQQTGFSFYTKEFRDLFYTVLPLLYFAVGTVALAIKKRFFDVLISLAVVVPAAMSGLNSVNRYVLHALPILLIFGTASWKMSWLRYVILVVCFALFGLFMVLHMRQFWVA